MSRLTVLARHEWRMLWAGRLAAAALAIGLALGAYGAVNGARWAADVQARMDATEADERTRLESMRAEVVEIHAGRAEPARFRDPRKASWVGDFLGSSFATWPLAPLTPWALGQRDLLPSYLKVSTLSRDAWIFEDEIENVLHLALGRFDLAFVAVFVLPLLVLALSFDLVSSERESGTLPLLLSQPVTLASVLVAKLLVRLAWAGLLSTLLVMAGLWLARPAGGQAVSVWQMALWGLTTWTYLAVWVAIAALVNLTGAPSAANAVRLTGIWMVLVVVAPALVGLAASTLHPAPTRIEMHEADRELRRELAPRSASLLEAYYLAHPERRPATPDRTDWAPGFYAAQIERERALLPLYSQHDTQARAQQDFVDRWRWVSPALVAQASFQDLAGTSASAFHHYIEQVIAYHEQWQAFFFPRLFARAGMTAADYDALPAFTYVPEPHAAVAARVSGRVAGLTGLALLLLAAAGWRLTRRAGAGTWHSSRWS